MGDTQAAPPWYPLALVDTVVDSASFAGGLPSPWGRLRGWDYTDALSPSWWSDLEEDRWGDWPADIKEVKVTGETRQGVVVDLDGRWTAHLFPFPTGQDISSLVRYGPWATSLQEAPLVLPVAGLVREERDLVVVFPRHEVANQHEVVKDPFLLAAPLGTLHAALVEHSTPNTERRWNERLKSVEDGLKSTTLWRAPHTRHVVGLPNVHLSLEGVLFRDGKVMFVPQPRPLVSALLCPDERLPGVAMAARLEQRLALMKAFASEEDRERFYRIWGLLYHQHGPRLPRFQPSTAGFGFGDTKPCSTCLLKLGPTVCPPRPSVAMAGCWMFRESKLGLVSCARFTRFERVACMLRLLLRSSVPDLFKSRS